MKHILILILLGAFCVTAKAQLLTYHERGYIVKRKSVYYSLTTDYPTGVAIPKRTIRRTRAKRHRPEKGILVPFADAKTFKKLGLGYGVDCYNVFFRGAIVENADPVTFSKVDFPIEFLLSGHMQMFYYKDKNHVYHMGEVLKGADAASFRYDTRDIALDKYNVYVWNIALDIDPNEYICIGSYIIGNGKVYLSGMLLTDVNPDSFRLLADGYATDGNVIVYDEKTMDADAPTFRKLLSAEGICYSPYHDCFYTDKYRLYLRGEPVEGSGSESKVLGKYHLISNENVFYRTNVIPGADAGSFLSLNEYWGKDEQSVYYQNKQVENADAATFKVVDKKDGLGFDKEHFFRDGKILLGIDGSSFRHYEGNLYVDNNYAYLISYLRVDKIPVDGKTFEKVGRKGGTTVYKDKNRMYKYLDGKLKKTR